MSDIKMKQKGMDAFKEGNYKKAIKFFNKFLEENDKDEMVLANIAESYLKLGSKEEGINCYNKLGKIQKSKGEFIDAKVTYKLLDTLKPNDPMVNSSLAEVEASLGNIILAVELFIRSYNIYMEEGKTKSALNILQQAKDLQPDNVELDILMAECYHTDGYITHSLRSYIAAIHKFCNKKDFNGAEKALSAMKVFGDDIPELYFGFGILLNARGEYDQSISQFQRALEILPTFFEALIGIGKALSNKGDFSKAMHYYKEAEKIETNSPLLLESIGDVFTKKKLHFDALEKYLHAFEGYKETQRYIEIFQLFGKILSIHPENLYVLENWGDLLIGLGNIEEAVDKYEKCFNFYIREELFENALEIGHKILQVSSERQDIAEKIKQIEAGITPSVSIASSSIESEAISDEAVLEDTETPQYRSPEEETKFGLIKEFLDKNDFTEAVKVVDGLIDSDPEYPDYYLTKAEILIGTDQFDESIKNYEKAAELYAYQNNFKKSVYAYKQVNNLLESIKAEKEDVPEKQEQGYDDKTLELIEDYIKDGDKYVKDGNIKEAKEVYRKILNVYPDYLVAKEKLSELSLIETFGKKAQEVIEDGDYYSNFNLGIAYLEMGLYDQAIEQFKLSLNDKEYALPSFEMIATTFVSINQYDKAIQWINQGLEKPGYSSKDYLPLKYEMAHIYEKMGNLSSAIRWYNEVFKQDFKFRNVGKKLSILGKKIKGTSDPKSNTNR